MIAGAYLVSAQPALLVLLFLVAVAAVVAPASPAGVSVVPALARSVVVSTAPGLDLGGTLLAIVVSRGVDSHPRAARRVAVPAPDSATRRLGTGIEPRRDRVDHRGRPLATPTVDTRWGRQPRRPHSPPLTVMKREARPAAARSPPTQLWGRGCRRGKPGGGSIDPNPGPSDQHRARRRRGRHRL